MEKNKQQQEAMMFTKAYVEFSTRQEIIFQKMMDRKLEEMSAKIDDIIEQKVKKYLIQ